MAKNANFFELRDPYRGDKGVEFDSIRTAMSRIPDEEFAALFEGVEVFLKKNLASKEKTKNDIEVSVGKIVLAGAGLEFETVDFDPDMGEKSIHVWGRGTLDGGVPVERQALVSTNSLLSALNQDPRLDESMTESLNELRRELLSYGNPFKKAALG